MSLFCLIHGSTQSPAGWDLLVPQLRKRGHDTICVDLPTNEPEASATRYAQHIAESLAHTGAPAIVVAHSASGLFLPLVPSYHPVSRLVFLASVVPEIGKSLAQQFQHSPQMIQPHWVGKDPTKDHEAAQHFLFHDCSPEILPWALSTLRLFYAKRAMEEICPLERWPTVPSTYINCREDRTLNPDWWRTVARQRLGSEPIDLSSGHIPHVSRPAELAAILSALSGS